MAALDSLGRHDYFGGSCGIGKTNRRLNRAHEAGSRAPHSRQQGWLTGTLYRLVNWEKEPDELVS